MRSLTRLKAAIVFSAFFGLAALQTWPLPRHLDTHLTGSPAGDTGVYVWNLWVFQHELLDQGRWPLATDRIFAGDRPANLAHHNYTAASNLMALPLHTAFDIVTTFNLVLLLNLALAGFGLFLLARRVTTSNAEALLAGAFFMASGFMVGRATAHFSLVAAAPLPLFLWTLLRCWERRRTRDAVALGATMAWALASDAYYGVYCLILAIGFMAAQAVSVSREPRQRPVVQRALLIIAVLAGAIVIGRLVLGGGSWSAGPVRISIRSLYTPVLILTAALALRALLTLRLRPSWAGWPSHATMMRMATVTTAAALLASAPMLIAQVAGDRMESPTIFWRTGPRGADLLAFVLPHWQHPWLADWARAALATHPEGLIEQSVSWSPAWWLLIGLAAAWAGWRPPRRWLWMAVGFGVLALGPFVFIAGVNTHVPTPWAVLRYVPLLGEARMPSRMAVLATLAAAMLLASALSALTRRWPSRRPLVLTAATLVLAVGLWPAPRPLHDARVPAIYDRITRDARDVSVLVLPTGVRDGLRSLGDFSAESQFHQTTHGKRLVGGYLSRTGRSRRAAHRAHPVLGPLIRLSDDDPVGLRAWTAARNDAGAFIAAEQLAYVIVDHERASPDLERFAVDVLRLTRVERDGRYSLYVTPLR